MQFFSSNKRLQEIFFQNHPSPPQELNGRPLNISYEGLLLAVIDDDEKVASSKKYTPIIQD